MAAVLFNYVYLISERHLPFCITLSKMEQREINENDLKQKWISEQTEIAARTVAHDDNNWSHFFANPELKRDRDLFIAGTDISFSTSRADLAIGTLVIAKLRISDEVDIVYSKSREVNVPHPYIPSFLGFREAPVVSELLRELPTHIRECIDCLLLDGNGMLHPRKAGFACQVGVRENMVTIGVSKALLCVDGLVESETRQLAISSGASGADVVGVSGTVWAKAILTGNAQSKPIYVSVGHKVSLSSAFSLVQKLCKFRVPSPIREADLHSRALLRGEQLDVYKPEEFYTALPIKSEE